MALKTTVFALCLAGSVGVGASAQEATEETKENYKTKCAACHLADGKGAMPEMNLTDAKWEHGSTVAEITKVIAEGVAGKAMMPFKAQLSDEQIEALAHYVRTFDKTLKPEKPAKAKK
jgi:cytochrome c oxidase cbb3-type subunit III